MHICCYEDGCICISSSSCIFCVGSYLYSSIGSYTVRPCRSMSWQGYTQSSCLVVDYTYVSLHVNCIVWCIKSVPEVDTLYAQEGTTRLHSYPQGSCCFPHCWFIVSVACISVATRNDVFVFRPVLASFVLDLICILPLDLMHFARVDPWADEAIHSLVVLWSTALMCHSMSLHRLVHKECPWGEHSL